MNSLATLSPGQLRKAADIQERIVALKAEFEQLLGAGVGTPAPVTAEPKKRRKFSAAARANMRQAQKARWAKIKGQEASPTPAQKPKRKMSAAGRAAIAAAAKARWAKVKAVGKRGL